MILLEISSFSFLSNDYTAGHVTCFRFGGICRNGKNSHILSDVQNQYLITGLRQMYFRFSNLLTICLAFRVYIVLLLLCLQPLKKKKKKVHSGF